MSKVLLFEVSGLKRLQWVHNGDNSATRRVGERETAAAAGTGAAWAASVVLAGKCGIERQVDGKLGIARRWRPGRGAGGSSTFSSVRPRRQRPQEGHH